MKTVVKLAVVLAIVLIVSSSAFADFICTQYCYEITATDENSNTNTDTWFAELCPDGSGYLYTSGGTLALYLFGGGPSWFNTSGDPMFGGKPFFTSWIATDVPYSTVLSKTGYLQPLLGGLLLTGEGVSNGTRYTVNGKQVPLANCPLG